MPRLAAIHGINAHLANRMGSRSYGDKRSTAMRCGCCENSLSKFKTFYWDPDGMAICEPCGDKLIAEIEKEGNAMKRTKDERRAEALERLRASSYDNSRAKRLGTKTREEWQQSKEARISHLEEQVHGYKA
jgi:hypothetical protein